jgi:hypothetical protein
MRQEQTQHRAEGYGDYNTADDFKHAGSSSEARQCRLHRAVERVHDKAPDCANPDGMSAHRRNSRVRRT